MSALPSLFAVRPVPRDLHIRVSWDALDGTYSYKVMVTVLDGGGRVLANRTDGFREGALDLLAPTVTDVVDGFLWAEPVDAPARRLKRGADTGRRITQPDHETF